MQPFDPLDLTADQTDRARAHVHSAALAAGYPVKDEYTADEACCILRACGYAVTPGVLAEFVRKGYVAPAEAWSPGAVFLLGGALDQRRRWLPSPSPHDCRKTGLRLQIEREQAAGNASPIADLDAVTVEDLLLRMVEANDRTTREICFEALRLKLDHFEE